LLNFQSIGVLKEIFGYTDPKSKFRILPGTYSNINISCIKSCMIILNININIPFVVPYYYYC